MGEGEGPTGGGPGSSVRRRRRWLHVDMAGPSTDKACGRGTGRGLHSFTFQLNLSRLLSLAPPRDTSYAIKRA